MPGVRSPTGEVRPTTDETVNRLSFRCSPRKKSKTTHCKTLSYFGISDARPGFIRKKTGACLLRSASSAVPPIGHSR